MADSPREATPEEARWTLDLMAARAEDEAAGVTRLTVMADYGGSPIWRAHNAGRVWPEDLGLSVELCARVRRWAHPFEVADSSEYDREDWHRDGALLAEAIAAELGPSAVVDYHPDAE